MYYNPEKLYHSVHKNKQQLFQYLNNKKSLLSSKSAY